MLEKRWRKNMEQEDNKLDQATEDAIEEAVDSNDNIKQLRDEFKKLKAENKQFKAQAMNTALQSLGLDAEKGIGKAVTKLYTGEPNIDEIKDFVSKEFGDSINDGPTTTQQEQQTQNIVASQGRVEQLDKIGVNAEPVDISQEFNNFINDSNTSTRDSINAKLRMIDTLKEQKK